MGLSLVTEAMQFEFQISNFRGENRLKLAECYSFQFSHKISTALKAIQTERNIFSRVYTMKVMDEGGAFYCYKSAMQVQVTKARSSNTKAHLKSKCRLYNLHQKSLYKRKKIEIRKLERCFIFTCHLILLFCVI